MAPGAPIQRSLPHQAKHNYSVTLAAGQFFRVRVQELQYGVSATLMAPNGGLVQSASGPDLPSFAVAAIAESSGAYRIVISSGAPEDRTARYRLTLEPPRPATPGDRVLVAAYGIYH